MTTAYTVGVGKRVGGTLAELKTELEQIHEQYQPPDDAVVLKTSPGSPYMFELIWVGSKLEDT